MTKDVIALTPTMPDLTTFLAGLYAGGPDIAVRSRAEGAVVELCTPDGRTAVSIEAPLLIHTPGEVARLLGPGLDVPEGPVWWTEARANAAMDGAQQLAASFAGRLTAVLGGTIWPPGPLTTDVIRLNPAPPAAPEPADNNRTPGIDILTNQAAVTLHDRPLVALTTWLSDALRTAAQRGVPLQIVTPPHARLTMPTRTALGGHPNRWVVQTGDGTYYDGLSGTRLHWDNGQFRPKPAGTGEQAGTAVHERFLQAQPDTSGRQLLLSIRTCHEPTADLLLGATLETAFTRLTGRPPAGWSTSEPINLPWSPRQLTDLARRRAPHPTSLLTIGHPDRPAIATTRVTRTTNGVEEDITLVLGQPDGQPETPDAHSLRSLAHALIERHGLITMLTSTRSSTPDLTVPSGLETPPHPIAFTLGPEAAKAVRRMRLDSAREGDARAVPHRAGPAHAHGHHYELTATTPSEAWETLGRLTQRPESS